MTSTSAIQDHLTRVLMNAGASLMQHQLTQLQAQDPDAAAGLERMLRSGALIALTCQLAPASGLARMLIEAVPPSGEAMQLMAVELQRETSQ
jgi:hypothetical protein